MIICVLLAEVYCIFCDYFFWFLIFCFINTGQEIGWEAPK